MRESQCAKLEGSPPAPNVIFKHTPRLKHACRRGFRRLTAPRDPSIYHTFIVLVSSQVASQLEPHLETLRLHVKQGKCSHSLPRTLCHLPATSTQSLRRNHTCNRSPCQHNRRFHTHVRLTVINDLTYLSLLTASIWKSEMQ